MPRTFVRSRVVLVSCLFATFCLLALAARGGAQESTARSDQETGGKSVTITGCVQKGVEAGGVFLAGDDGKMWELSSRTVKLDGHMGHKVTVTGDVMQKSKAAEGKMGTSETTEAAGKPYGDVNVTDLKMVSETCGEQDKAAVGTAGSMSDNEKAMMDAMMKAATPGPNHQMLTSIAGNWTFKNRMWMNPSAPPTESTGTVTYTTLLGGRYVQGQYRGDMMGMPFEGLGLLGYDNTSGQFQLSWADNMGTTIMYMTGQYDPASKSITYTGQEDDMVKPGTKVPVRQVVRFVSPDSHVMEWYETRDGKEMKMMEIVYNRAK